MKDEEIFGPWKLKRLKCIPEAIKLREKGHTFKEIAKILNISYVTAWNWVHTYQKGDIYCSRMKSGDR